MLRLESSVAVSVDVQEEDTMGNQPLMQASVEVVNTFEQVAHDGSFLVRCTSRSTISS